ncbi:MAG: 50S ribosomal protein L11 methyltransferase [Clostridia bacterium]|nr:50S ribosomal protein L11 methyltransferase [Clostridia bacterium]
MDWTEILVTVPNACTETAAAVCNMVTRLGIYIEDYSQLEKDALEIAHIDLIDEELLGKQKDISVIHIYFSKEENILEALEFLNEALKNANINYKINEKFIKDSEWADNWKKFFKVTEIGEKLVICPSWEDYNNVNNKAVLKIDPGAAFGTGTHATTSLCLKLLEKYVENSSTVLDIGTGSGILSIAACLLGAQNALGVDIDPTSVKVANENAALNNIAKNTKFMVGNLADDVKGQYDIICANIVADVIINLCDSIKNFMKPNTVLIASGIIDIRMPEVKNAFLNANLKIIEELKLDNWYAFALKGDF